MTYHVPLHAIFTRVRACNAEEYNDQEGRKRADVFFFHVGACSTAVFCERDRLVLRR